jgi:hypothetical protein
MVSIRVAVGVQVSATQVSAVRQSSSLTRPAEAGRWWSAQMRPPSLVVRTTTAGTMNAFEPFLAPTRAPTAHVRDAGQLKAVEVQALSGSVIGRHMRPWFVEANSLETKAVADAPHFPGVLSLPFGRTPLAWTVT